ncbi:MAG: ThiF family adenylyltransferase [Candidatus Hodarchaeota archaeon]
MPSKDARYQRFIVLRDVGKDGLKRIRAAKVAVVGIGGLGSISATKFTTLGVDHLRIIDPDVVDASNLQRQFLYREKDIGKPKTALATRRLQPLNPEVTIEPRQEQLAEETVDELIRGMDIIVDGLDRFGPRYIINRACVRQGIPYAFAGALGAVGNLTTILPGKTPCLECIYGGVDDARQPTCDTIGIYPTLLGVVANIQVHEAVRILLGKKPRLAGHLLFIDLNDLRFDQIPIAYYADCPVCSSIRRSV